MKEFTNRIPKAIWDKGFVLFKVKVLGPLFDGILIATLSILLIFNVFEIRSA